MLMRFSCATFLALAGIAGTDAFLAPSTTQSRVASLGVGSWDNDDFLSALSGDGSNKPEDDKEEEEEVISQGGSRFKSIMEAAKQQGGGAAEEMRPVSIENPFLNPTPSQPTNPDDLSVEEQARMFREMMQQGGGQPQAPQYQPPKRVAKTDRAGRPVGRNRDADQIANTADLYFAQLKRDSTVRTLQRIRGEHDEAEQVFADEGIKELDGLLQKNPYLQG